MQKSSLRRMDFVLTPRLRDEDDDDDDSRRRGKKEKTTTTKTKTCERAWCSVLVARALIGSLSLSLSLSLRFPPNDKTQLKP